MTLRRRGVWLAALLAGLSSAAANAEEYQVEFTQPDGKRVVRGRVDTDLDSFTITEWTDATGGDAWLPRETALPVALFAYDKTGKPFDVPAKWDGKFDGWAFLLPAGRDVRDVGWVQGEVPKFWAGSSFGWGGLRNGQGAVVLDASARGLKYAPAGRATGDKPKVSMQDRDMTAKVTRVAKAPAPKGKPAPDLLKAGAAWSGPRLVNPERAAGGEWSLSVTKRDGKTFEGELTGPGVGGKAGAVKVTGLAHPQGDGPVRFRTDTTAGRVECLGQVKGGVLVLGFEIADEAGAGKKVTGTATLESKKSEPKK